MIKLTQLEIDSLHCKDGEREEHYKLELIDRYGIKKCDLELKHGTVELNADNPIQRTAIFNFSGNKKIKYLTDRVKPYMGVVVGNTLKWYPLGVFLLVKPKFDKGDVNVQCFDETIILDQSYILEPKYFQKGTTYIEVLKYLIISCDITKINIASTDLVLQTDMMLDDTKSKLQWFNHIASQINYTNLTVDSDGWFVSKKYVEPSPASATYIYKNNNCSVLLNDISSNIDFWKVPNVFKRVLNNSRLGEMVSIYKNEDPVSDFSIKNRGFEIVDIKKVDNIASKEELEMLARKDAFKAMQITKSVNLPTLNMPHHESLDIFEVRSKDESGIFVEHGWVINLSKGAIMQHKLKRLVSLN